MQQRRQQQQQQQHKGQAKQSVGKGFCYSNSAHKHCKKVVPGAILRRCTQQQLHKAAGAKIR